MPFCMTSFLLGGNGCVKGYARFDPQDRANPTARYSPFIASAQNRDRISTDCAARIMQTFYPAGTSIAGDHRSLSKTNLCGSINLHHSLEGCASRRSKPERCAMTTPDSAVI